MFESALQKEEEEIILISSISLSYLSCLSLRRLLGLENQLLTTIHIYIFYSTN